MSNKAIEVLMRARTELMLEIERCGEAGGVGRVVSFAPTLVNVQNAIDIISKLDQKETPMGFGEKMTQARAAKKIAAAATE